MRATRLLLLILALAYAVVPSSAAAQERAPTLDALLESFAAMPGLTARFTEEKTMAMLAHPIRTEGEIAFAPPNRLLRRVTRPTRSTTLLVGSDLVLSSGGRREEISLSENAVVAGFVDTFRQVLAGDRGALERTWRVSFETSDTGWRLVLRPRPAALRRFVREMVLEGEGLALRAIDMLERNGDRTVTRFTDVNARKRWSRAELARVFRS